MARLADQIGSAIAVLDIGHWRKRLGDKLELLLAESLRVAHASGALRSRDLARVTVDTTVQPKNITLPTDAKLLHAATAKLTGCEVERAYVDKSYRGHEAANPRRVFISGQKRGAFGTIASYDADPPSKPSSGT
jgi:hypothetical protein